MCSLCGVIEVDTHMEPNFFHIFDFFSEKMYVYPNQFPYFSVALCGPDICTTWRFPNLGATKVISNLVLKSALKFDSRYWQLFFLFYLNIFLFFDHIYIWFGDIWANFFFDKKFKKNFLCIFWCILLYYSIIGNIALVQIVGNVILIF